MSIRQALNTKPIKHAGRLEYLCIRTQEKQRITHKELGCYLVMTGRGCDDISVFSTVGELHLWWKYVPTLCERRYGLDNFISRLDIAIDDKNRPFFTIEQIRKMRKKNLFLIVGGYHALTKASLMISTPQKDYLYRCWKIRIVLSLYDKDKEVCSKHNKATEEVGS